MKWLIWVVLAFVLLSLWVRFAPAPVAKWHDPEIPEHPDRRLSYRVSLDVPLPAVQALHEIQKRALATPRTKLFAGSPEAGKVTFVSRSLLWGFPDYSTATAVPFGGGSHLTIYGRLRFGLGDVGVNRKRIKSWLQSFDTIKQ